jgi:DNA-binding CsgD family transcriptional regulator
MLKGRRRAETASDLFISEATVKKHSAAIYEKFGVKDRFELLSKLT